MTVQIKNLCGQGDPDRAALAASWGNRDAMGKSSSGQNNAISKPQTLREFERALRGLGYSKREAMAIAKVGFAGIGDATDDTAEKSEIAKLLARNIKFLKDQT